MPLTATKSVVLMSEHNCIRSNGSTHHQKLMAQTLPQQHALSVATPLIRPLQMYDRPASTTSVSVPSNAFEIYPYCLTFERPKKNDIISEHRTSKSILSAHYECFATCNRNNMNKRTDATSVIESAIGYSFLSVITSSVQMYNLAMANICSILKMTTTVSTDGGPCFSISNQRRRYKTALRMLQQVIVSLSSLETKIGTHSSTDAALVLHLFRRRVINQVRLAALNNMAFMHSEMDQQRHVDMCLSSLKLEFDERHEISDKIKYWIRMTDGIEARSSVARSDPCVHFTQKMSEERNPRLNQMNDSIEQLHGSVVHWLLEVLIESFELEEQEMDGMREKVDLGDNCGVLIIQLNVLLLHPSGGTPIIGATAA
jgi:hypothetical protein